jgi:hypothetical protein
LLESVVGEHLGDGMAVVEMPDRLEVVAGRFDVG